MDETEALREEIEKMKEDHEIELLLAENGVKNMKAAMAVFDREKIRGEDGKLENVKSAVSEFKNENGWLFEKPTALCSTGFSSGRGGNKLSSEMTDEEYYTALSEKRKNRYR